MSLLIIKKGRGSLIWKRDLKNCHRPFRIDPGDVRKLGYKVDDQILVGLAIPMGLSPGAYMSQRITSAEGYIISNMRLSVMVYLDDFSGVEVPEFVTAAYKATGQLFVRLGLEEKLPKSSPPLSRRIVLGVCFDTNTLTMEIDPVRLEHINSELTGWLGKKQITKKEVESLVGLLNFVAK